MMMFGRSRSYEPVRMMIARSFNTANATKLRTYHVLTSARVQLDLPSRGPVWMFVDHDTTVDQLKAMIVAEDDQVKSLDVFNAGQKVDSTEQIFKRSMQDVNGDQMKLKINDVEFELKPALQHLNSLNQAGKAHVWDTVTKKEGLLGIHDSTISTIINLTEQNLDFSKGVTPDQICQTFKE